MSLRVAILGTQWGSEVFNISSTFGVDLVDNREYDDMKSTCVFFHLTKQLELGHG